MRLPKLLLLGIRHAVRAPMAEAIFRSRLGDAVELASAGMEAAPLHPLTVPVLEEAGFTLHAHAPVSAKTLLGRSSFSTVILISGRNDPRRPRMFFGALNAQSWEIEDPAQSPERDRLDAFRRCRDRIVHLVDVWAGDHLELQTAAASSAEDKSTRVMRIPKPNRI